MTHVAVHDDYQKTVIEKFKQVANLEVTHISNWMMCGGMEHEKLMRSVRLMGEVVIPALRDVRPPDDLPDQLLTEWVDEHIAHLRDEEPPRVCTTPPRRGV